MSQHDYSIANQGFPATRADINNVLSAIATNNSGTSAPSTQYAGQFWIDTTSSTWTLYIHDGADDIQFATIDTSANTVNFTDSALDVVTDTTPQLGGDLDANGNNILFDDGTGINDDDDNELIRFQKIASAVNQIDISNSATGNAPEISATGDDTNIDLKFTTKGTGNVISNSNILFDTASKGIYLGVTTPTASNLLDDYEEGTWTPILATDSGSITISASNPNLWYVKIGRIVHIGGRINLDSTSSPSGDVFLQGLPFASSTISGVDNDQYIVIYGNEFATALVNNGPIGTFFANGTTSIRLRDSLNGTTAGSSMANHFDASTKLFVTGTYITG